jgi:hypothetical protein
MGHRDASTHATTIPRLNRTPRSVALKRHKIDVAAPRELVFEVIASAGRSVGETYEGKLVEFETRWRGRVIKTVELVMLDPPARIGYRWVEGPLDRVEEEILLDAPTPGKTVMTYAGRLGTEAGLKGWLRTMLFVRPIFNSLIRSHLLEGKTLAEKRSRRSRVHRRSGADANG